MFEKDIGLMREYDEGILKRVLSKIIENEGNHDEKLENEISKELMEYLNRNSCFRKKIPYVSDENLRNKDDNVNYSLCYISDEIDGSEIKLGCRSMKYLADILDSAIISENKFIIDYLLNYGEKYDLTKNMKANTIEKIIGFLNDNPDIVIIADMGLKTLIAINELDNGNQNILGDSNICYLDEAQGYIILIYNLEDMFEIFEHGNLISFNNVSDEKTFKISIHDEISINKINKESISVIKLN